MPRPSHLVLWAFICVALCLPAAPPARAQESAPLPAVVVAPAEMTSLEQAASFAGRLVAAQKVDIVARVQGFIRDILFTEGGKVEAGATLFVIEDDAYTAAVAEIEGLILAARAELELAELERERTARLVTRGTLAQADLDRADAAVAQARGSLARLEAQLQKAELDLSYTRVTAPFAGRVGLTDFDRGALVSPSSGPLVTLVNADPVYAEFPVSTATLLRFQRQVAAGELEPEGTISILLPDGSTHPQTGTIDFIDTQVARGTDTILLRAEFPNPDGRLLDGSLIQVRIAQAETAMDLAVPAQAVQRDMAGAFVLVVDDAGMVELRRVDAGASNLGRVEILGGLSEGDMVITEGINKVRPGMQVDAATAADG